MKWTWTRRTQHKIWLMLLILARANLSEMNFPETPLRCATDLGLFQWSVRVIRGPGVSPSYSGNRIRMYAGPVSWVSNYKQKN